MTFPSIAHLADAIEKADPNANRLGDYVPPVSSHLFNWEVAVTDECPDGCTRRVRRQDCPLHVFTAKRIGGEGFEASATSLSELAQLIDAYEAPYLKEHA
jgi:hypothetical protein